MFFNRVSGIGAIIQPGFWTMDHASRDTVNGMDTTSSQRPKYTMHERDSDDCLTELLGTR